MEDKPKAVPKEADLEPLKDCFWYSQVIPELKNVILWQTNSIFSIKSSPALRASFLLSSLFCRNSLTLILFDLIQLLGGKARLCDRGLRFWEAEIGKFVVADADHIVDLIPVII